MREEEEKGGTRGNMLHLIVLEYSCSLKLKNKAIETGKDRKKQEKAGNSRLLLKMFFCLLRSVVRMLRTTESVLLYSFILPRVPSVSSY